MWSNIAKKCNKNCLLSSPFKSLCIYERTSLRYVHFLFDAHEIARINHAAGVFR